MPSTINNFKIADFSIDQRPRERLQMLGTQALSNWELLSILIGSGTADADVVSISHKILLKYGNLGNLYYADYAQLNKFKGLGKAKISVLLSALEIARRINTINHTQTPYFKNPLDYYNFIKHQICYSDKENLVLFCLNTRMKLLRHEILTIGTVNQSLIHPREVFKPAITNLATYIVLAHNHPSGDINPSQEDITTTERVLSASKLIGIPLVDHIIMSSNGYFSMKSNGYL